MFETILLMFYVVLMRAFLLVIPNQKYFEIARVVFALTPMALVITGVLNGGYPDILIVGFCMFYLPFVRYLR